MKKKLIFAIAIVLVQNGKTEERKEVIKKFTD